VFVFKDEKHGFAPANDDYFKSFKITVDDEQLISHVTCSGTGDESTLPIVLQTVSRTTEV
jgi:hypothetical protein